MGDYDLWLHTIPITALELKAMSWGLQPYHEAYNPVMSPTTLSWSLQPCHEAYNPMYHEAYNPVMRPTTLCIMRPTTLSWDLQPYVSWGLQPCHEAYILTLFVNTLTHLSCQLWEQQRDISFHFCWTCNYTVYMEHFYPPGCAGHNSHSLPAGFACILDAGSYRIVPPLVAWASSVFEFYWSSTYCLAYLSLFWNHSWPHFEYIYISTWTFILESIWFRYNFLG